MLKQLLLLTLILLGIQSACSPGCSKCVKNDSEDVCEICDLSRFYYLNNDGTCEMKTKSNCKIPSPSSTSKLCIQCDDEHFYDELAQACVSVPESKKDENCSVYSLVADCLRCKEGHIVENGTCVVPTNVIANCLWQVSEDNCQTCESGFELNVSRTTCISFTTVNNCHQHQEFYCDRCNNDYTLAINSGLLLNMSLSNLQASLTGDLSLAIALDSAKEDCVKKDITHCVTYDSYGRCELCDSSFYVDPLSGNCSVSQEPIIFKCKTYTNVSTCKECDFGFYLNSNKCIGRTIIDKCVTYTSDLDKCEECKEGYYSAGSSCQLRNVSANINHCKTYKNDQDSCQECEQPFVLSTDFLKCFEPIKHCIDVVNAVSTGTLTCNTCAIKSVPLMDSSVPPLIIDCEMRNNSGCITWSADNSNECSACLSGYFWLNPSNNLCQQYTKKCMTYEVGSDDCASCYSDQYLDNSNTSDVKCVSYTVKNCLTFEPNLDNCATCRTDYYMDAVKKECHPYTLVNCNDKHPTQNECLNCSPGFYLADSLTCLPEDLWECSQSSGSNTCTTCNPGFYLLAGKCYPGTQTGCDPSSYTTNADACTTCLPGYWNDSSSRCHAYTVSNCQGTTNNGFSPTSDECTDCLPGFFLNSSQKCETIKIPNCVKADTAGTNCSECAVGFYDDSQACLAQYIAFCEVYTPELNECTTCKKGYYLNTATVCSKNVIPNCLTHTPNLNTCDVCDNGFQAYNSKASCVATDSPGCTSYADGLCTNKNDNYYFDTSTPPQVVPRVKAYCIESTETNGGCTTCADGYKIDSVGGINECIALTAVANCETLNLDGTCLVCENGYYTDNSGVSCSKLTLDSNCIEYSLTEDKCVFCKNSYYLATGTCTSGSILTLNCKGTSGGVNISENCTDCPNGSNKFGIADAYYIQNPPGVESLKIDNEINQVAEGYQLNNNQPEAIPNNSDCVKLVSNVTTVTGTVTIDTASSCSKCRDYTTHHLTGGTCILRTFFDCGIFDKANNDCLACREGLDYTSGGINTCTEAAITTATNCKYTNKNAQGCYQCDPDYIVDSTGGTNLCVSNTTLKNCRIFAGTATICTTCDKGFYWDDVDLKCRMADTCILEEDTVASMMCGHCLPGLKPKAGNKYVCEPTLYDDICLIYSNSLNNDGLSYCTRCKQPGTVPLNYVNGSTVTFRCVPKQYDFLTPIGIIYDGSSYTFRPSAPAVAGGYSKITPLDIGSISTATHICQPMDISQCKTYNFSADFEKPCTECNYGYYLTADTKICLLGGIAGCKSYNAYDNCKTCEDSWTLVANSSSKNYCKPFEPVPFCESHKVNTSECNKCAKGYSLRNTRCYAEVHANCKYYDYNLEICFGCEEGNYLKDGKCNAYEQTNCLEFSRVSDSCNVCAADFYLEKGSCKWNTSLNCSEKSRLANICVSCNEKFYLDAVTSLCEAMSATNCKINDQESSNCITCEPGYYLSNGMCSPYSVQNCALRDSGMDRCELCYDGFFLNSLGFCELYTIANCAVRTANTNQCNQCKPGYYLAKPSACEVHTVKNCNVYSDYTNECLSCQPGHFKNPSNNCIKYTNTKNCDLVDPSQDLCVTCRQGYYMDFGVCEQYTVRNCSLYKPDANLCMTCKNGYFLLKNNCEPYTIRCEQYSLASNTCITCLEGYYLDEGLCYVNNGLFCKERSPFRNGCKSCLDDFYLDNGQCKIRKNSRNCKEVIETGDLCLSCFSTHYLAGGICISYARDTCKTFDEKKDLCLECETNKYWMSHNVCENYTVKNCKVYSPTSDKCVECEVGTWYVDPATGNCLNSTPVDKCKIYSNTVDECAVCEDGNYLATGTECRRNPSGLFKCIQYKDETTCIKCDTGFFLQNNSCQKSMVTIDNCINYFEEGKCNECNSNYFILDNACIEKVETSCLEWKDSQNCLDCPQNYILSTNSDSNKVCLESGLDHCVKAEEGNPTNICLECAEKKILVNQSCQDPVSPLTGCKIYVEEGVCNECDDGYTLTKAKNGCVSNFSLMSSNCAFGVEKSSPVCRSCMSGYHLDSDRVCVSCGGNGCDVCDPYDSTKCLFCKAGYDHDGSTCSQGVTADSGTSSRTNRISDSFNTISGFNGIFILFSSFVMIFYI